MDTSKKLLPVVRQKLFFDYVETEFVYVIEILTISVMTTSAKTNKPAVLVIKNMRFTWFFSSMIASSLSNLFPLSVLRWKGYTGFKLRCDLSNPSIPRNTTPPIIRHISQGNQPIFKCCPRSYAHPPANVPSDPPSARA
jgi:hypothetical protein